MPASEAAPPRATPRLDVVYPSNFYAYQTPVVLDYVAALGGWAPPRPRGEGFAYLDLGCGDGFTLVLLAAMYPECRFIGVDLDPRHVARGRALAAAGGLANLTLVEADFSDWRRLDLPRLHYVALHGVWAWISAATRAAAVELLADRVEPGGLVYLGYNALPGWAGAAPLRQFFLDWTGGGDAVAGVRATLQRLEALRRAGAEYFVKNPVAAALLDEWREKDPHYVAHEIFSPEWAPQPFVAVARDLAAAGLRFAGSADLFKNFPHASLKPALARVFAAEKDRIRAETLRDYAANTRFRRDVFVKPGAPLDPAEFETRPFGLRLAAEESGAAIDLPAGRVDISGEPFRSIRGALANGSKSVVELAALLGAPKRKVLEAVQLLSLGWQVAPFALATVAATPPRRWTVKLPINAHLLEHPVEQGGFELLAAPPTGSALALPKTAVAALKKGEAPQGRLSKWVELGLIAPA
jgi:SAM-dependent methyltransferase